MAWRERRTISLEVGWAFVQRGITKLQNILEGKPEQPFSSMEYMLLHGTIYDMCTQKPPHNYSSQLYSRHRESLYEYFRSAVLPSIREKHDEFMLRELVQRWEGRNVMIMWFASIFRCLDLYHETWGSSSSLEELGRNCFHE